MASREPPPKKQRVPTFRLELTGHDAKEVILEKMTTAREILTMHLGKSVNNRIIVEHALDCFIAKSQGNEEQNPCFTTYQKVNNDNDTLFISAFSSAKKLTEICENHLKVCSASLNHEHVTMSGHVGIVKLSCSGDTKHTYQWSSSPHLTDNRFLVNHRMQLGYSTTGILPIQYQRFSQAAGIGWMPPQGRKRNEEMIKECIEEEYEASIQEAMDTEIGLTLDTIENGINVISDARHSTRKNAKDTSVVVIGEKGHKVLSHEHVTKQQERITQRHETVGTTRVMDKFEEDGVDTNIWNYGYMTAMQV